MILIANIFDIFKNSIMCDITRVEKKNAIIFCQVHDFKGDIISSREFLTSS